MIDHKEKVNDVQKNTKLKKTSKPSVFAEKLHSLLTDENNVDVATWHNGDGAGKIRFIDEDKLASNLGFTTLRYFRIQMNKFSFKKITNKKKELFYKSSVTSEDLSSVLQLNYKSYWHNDGDDDSTNLTIDDLFAPVDVLTTPPLPFDKELDEVLLQLNDSLSRQSDNEVVADNATEVVVSPSDTETQLNTHDNSHSQEDVGTDDTQLTPIILVLR